MRYGPLEDAESIFDNFDEKTLASITRLSDISNNIVNIVDDDMISVTSPSSDHNQVAIKKAKMGNKKRDKPDGEDKTGTKILETSDGNDATSKNKLLKFAKPKPPPAPMKSTTSDEAARLREAFTNQLKEQERKRLEGKGGRI